MAGRSRSSFGKRLKEMKRQEKRQDKAAKKDQRKAEKLSGGGSTDSMDDLGTNDLLPDDPSTDEDEEDAG